MTEHTEKLKQEILANILSTNNLFKSTLGDNPEDVKSSWRYDEQTDENWLSLHYPATVGSSITEVVKKKSKTNMSIIIPLGK